MTTRYLDNKIYTIKNVIVVALLTRNSVFGSPRKGKCLFFIVVSPSFDWGRSKKGSREETQ